MLPDVDEKQITWQNLIETVVSDRLEEDEEPIIEVEYGPSPVEVVSPLLELLRQFPHTHEHEIEWPDKDVQVGVDPAIDEDMTVVTEWARGHIIMAFGLSKEDLEVARDAFKESVEREIIYWHHVNVAAGEELYTPFCTPSRNKLTGE